MQRFLFLNHPEKNIVTLEDPVEYSVGWYYPRRKFILKQVLPLKKGIVRWLRQDPDIIMVGEIRDKNTARIAIEAALNRTFCFEYFAYQLMHRVRLCG